MYFFRNDYGEGAHSAIMDALLQSNSEHTAGYGEDPYCAKAREVLRREIGCSSANIHFISGGTQTNLLMISTTLRPHEAVISAETGHINTHETGAIEATGHKILTANAQDGKLTPDMIGCILALHTGAHMVKPRMVYISNATELGTIYTKSELEAISAYCKAKKLFLFMDGARLGAALTSDKNDLTLKDIARLTDCFYIGGTKNGALFGEALVIVNPALSEDFLYAVKQRGALFAKGRLLGIQFLTLFTDDLFYRIGRHENTMAARLKAGLVGAGYALYVDSCANMLFPLVPTQCIEKLSRECGFETMHEEGNNTCIRLVTSWATTQEDVDGFIAYIGTL